MLTNASIKIEALKKAYLVAMHLVRLLFLYLVIYFFKLF